MSNRFDLLDDMVKQGNGYLRTADVVARGISKPTLAEYVLARNMDRVAHGIYCSEEVWPDDLFLLSSANTRIIFSHETALYLHGLMERVKSDIYSLGIAHAQTMWGHSVPVYDKERTICDLLLYKQSTDIQLFQYAMKEYMSGGEKNLNHLMLYAEKLHIADKMRMYTEVML